MRIIAREFEFNNLESEAAVKFQKSIVAQRESNETNGFAPRLAVPVDDRSSDLSVRDDEGEQRSDLRKRTESKFVMPGADIEKIRQILLNRSQRQIHSDTISTVRSLYFDDPRFSACYANLEGLDNRRKVRVRWYDSLLPQHEFFFEVKWRENKLTGKHRLRLHSERPLHELSFREMQNQLMNILPSGFQTRFLRNIEPVSVVEYRREHFVTQDASLAAGVRLTLDYDLKFYDQTGRRSLRMDFARRLQDFVLIECKVPSGFAVRPESFFSPLTLRVESCSKYVLGCQTLELVRN